MPFLPDERSTDKLLKNLGIELAAEFGGRELADFGWFQYRDHDHLKTLVSTELAADAFLYLSFDACSWRRNPKVLTAIIAFMGRYHATGPTRADLLRLKEMINAQPFCSQAIHGWFQHVYPPDPAP